MVGQFWSRDWTIYGKSSRSGIEKKTGQKRSNDSSVRCCLPMFGRGHRRKTHRTHLLNNLYLYQALGSGQQNRTNQIIYSYRVLTMSRVPHIFHTISLKTPLKFNIGALLHPFNELLDRKCGPWGNPSSSPSSGWTLGVPARIMSVDSRNMYTVYIYILYVYRKNCMLLTSCLLSHMRYWRPHFKTLIFPDFITPWQHAECTPVTGVTPQKNTCNFPVPGRIFSSSFAVCDIESFFCVYHLPSSRLPRLKTAAPDQRHRNLTQHAAHFGTW